ncbi:MAG: S41 family peptidase [Bacteroidetes bacterium]|nr:S41 family peptidase [Bacteroidota bacterium]
MKKLLHRLPHKALLGITALLLGSVLIATAPGDHFFEISKNLDIFGKVLREVDNNFVDDIEPNAFMRVGIDAMLASLDPYTNYISASEIEEYQYQSTGQYGGIGAMVSKRKERFIVRECYPGKPAYVAGLRAGDEILKINNESMQGKNYGSLEIRNLLRGTPGTQVTLTVKRHKVTDPLEIRISRDKIKVDNVAYYGMVNETTGYVVLGSFTKDASQEVKTAFQTLRQQHPGIKALILDLRDNPGGLLYESINLANLFIPKGSKVVETRGKMEGSFKRYLAENNPLDTQIKLTVLINGRSASASEIVSGVVQDLDRGIIVGRRSFGKGLVQTTRPLSYRSQLKITTSRYYTPSGRCIQAVDYSHRNGKNKGVVKIADSLKSMFYTSTGRPVQDAGGIYPDALVPAEKYHKITRDLLTQDLIFDFVTEYHAEHPEIADPRSFDVSDALYDQFVTYVNGRTDFVYESRFAQELKKLESMLKEESYHQEVLPLYNALKEKIDAQRQNDIRSYRAEIKYFLRNEIVGRYYNRQGAIENSLRFDPYVLEAIRIMGNDNLYSDILSGKVKLNEGKEDVKDEPVLQEEEDEMVEEDE